MISYKKTLMPLFLAFLANLAQAQMGAVAAGGDGSGTGGSVSFSVGQVDYSGGSGPGGNDNQGVQQPFEFYNIIGVDEFTIELEASVYPNPTRESVTLCVSQPSLEGFSYSLFDMQGKLIETKIINSGLTMIMMDQLAQSTYLLSVQKQDQIVKSFQIIKNF